MSIETVRMSSKGQVVIPQRVRDMLNAQEGSVFAVVGNKDSVILKKIKTPSKEEIIAELKKIAAEGSRNAARLGIKESDVVDIVHRFRKSKEKR
jgi:AbrB family looped-hinge helix DNA binding protein